MKNTEFKKIVSYIKENEGDLDVNGFVDDKELIGLELDEVKDYIEGLNEDFGITDEEVIYYSVAIGYLKENDASLNESLDIASELGYTTENLNSELLATLLKSRNNLEEFNEFLEGLDDFIDNL